MKDRWCNLLVVEDLDHCCERCGGGSCGAEAAGPVIRFSNYRYIAQATASVRFRYGGGCGDGVDISFSYQPVAGERKIVKRQVVGKDYENREQVRPGDTIAYASGQDANMLMRRFYWDAWSDACMSGIALTPRRGTGLEAQHDPVGGRPA